MRVSVVGMGYVGLVSGVCLAERGHDVVCVDVDQEKLDLVRSGKAPIFEAGLETLIERNIGRRLNVTDSLESAVADSELTLIAVGTPFDGRQIDLSFIEASCRQIGEALRKKESRHEVIVKSTVVPGTTDDVVGPTLEAASGRRVGQGIGLGMNPEFLTEGTAVDDFMNPDRIVVGGHDEITIARLVELYAGFPEVEILRTNNRTAELIKYASNALLATMISFSNEVANLAATIGGVDAIDVMKGVHLSHYLSPSGPDGQRITAPIASFLLPGCGFGGSCLPKDVSSLAAQGRSLGLSMQLLDAVIEINELQPSQVIALLSRHFESLENVAVSVLGLAFKPDTDDVRHSPALPILRCLRDAGARLVAFDPMVKGSSRDVFTEGDVDFRTTLKDAVRGVDAVVLVTRWDEFEQLPSILANMDDPPLLVDGRRMLDKSSVTRYAGIGLS